MQNLRILNTREVKQVIKQLEDQWGFFQKLDYAFLMSPKEKIYLVSHDLKMIPDTRGLRVESLGMYFGEYKGGNIRLSIEGSQLVGPKATDNVVELTRDEMLDWFKGIDIDIDLGEESKFVILKNETDFIGSGRYKEGKILNFVPKARRLDYKFEED